MTVAGQQLALLEALAERALSTPEVARACGHPPTSRIPATAYSLERKGWIGRKHLLSGRVVTWELTDAGRDAVAQVRRGELRLVEADDVRPTHGVRSPDADDAA